jgi:acetolactate synthase small subunit
MAAFSFWREAMRWCFWTEMEDEGQMESRVLHVFDRLQAEVVTLASAKLDGRILLSCILEADDRQAARIEALLRKIHGMLAVKAVPEAATTQRMIVSIRILCDMTGRAEVLQFVAALGARTVMIRPMCVAFEVAGSPVEIDGVYQSARGYGIVDVLSAGCAMMTSTNDSEYNDRISSGDTEGVDGEEGNVVQEDVDETLESWNERTILKKNTDARRRMYQRAPRI